MDHIPPESLQLTPAGSLQEYQLHTAACEWSVQAPITINNESEIKAQNWTQCGLIPFRHQIRNLIYFFRKLPGTLIADDVGLGKTISAGMILSELIARRCVAKTLITTPKILCSQWESELREHFGINAVVSQSGAHFRQMLHDPNIHTIIITYHLLLSQLKHITPDLFQFGIFDEAHKLRNLYGTTNPPKIASQLKEAFEKQIFKFVLMLTATPMQSRIWDIYSLIDLLKLIEGEDNPFGTPDVFRTEYLQDARGVRLKPQKEAVFQRILQKSLCRTRRRDADVSFPKRIIRDIPFSPTAQENQLFAVLKQISQKVSMQDMQKISLVQGLLSSPLTFETELQKAATTTPKLKTYIPEVHQLVSQIGVPSKLRTILNYLQELKNRATRHHASWRAVIFTIRKDTQKQIQQWLAENNIASGIIQGGAPETNRKTIEAYSCEPPQINVIISTDTGAEGINLQAGNVVINYDLPWNPMVAEQRIGRVQRLGASFNEVFVVNPYAKDTLEDTIVCRLLSRLFHISQIAGDIESILGFNQDSDYDIEKEIRNLSLRFLNSQSYIKYRNKLERNLNRTNELYRRNQADIDQRFATTEWDVLLAPENRPPQLPEQSHSMTAQEFVEKTCGAANPWNLPENIWESAEELQNQTNFERLAKQWRKQASYCVYSIARPVNEEVLREIREYWHQQFPTTQILNISQCAPSQKIFQGEILIRAEAFNRIDRFQKVFTMKLSPESGTIPIPETLPPDTSLRTPDACIQEQQDIYERALPQISQAVTEDGATENFCRYYRRRMEEKQQSTLDTHLREKIEENYTPNTSIEICGIQGHLLEKMAFRVEYQADEHTYTHVLHCIPAVRYFEEIPSGTCDLTQSRVPLDILDTWESIGSTALRHFFTILHDGQHVFKEATTVCYRCQQIDLKSRMEISPVSHQMEHSSHKVPCSYSHKMVFPEELETSEVSNRQALPEYFRKSEKSGIKGILDELIQCTRTNKWLLKREALVREKDHCWYDAELFGESPVSHRKELLSEMERCELSGELVLPEELVTCCISNRRIRRDLASESPISHRLFSPELGVMSEGYLLPPDEICDVCNKPIFATDEVILNPETQHPCHQQHFVTSAVTHKILRKKDAWRSDFSLQYAEPEYFSYSDASGRRGLKDEFTTCAKTGKHLLKDEVYYSERDKCLYQKDLCVMSEETHYWGLKQDAVQCPVSHKILFPEEMETCEIHHKPVAKSLLITSAASGKRFCKSFGIKTLRGEWLMPGEAAQCTWGNGYLRNSEVKTCSLTKLPFDKTLLKNGVFHMLDHLLDAIHNGKKSSSGRFMSRLDARSLMAQPGWDRQFNPNNEHCRIRCYTNSAGVMLFCAQLTQRKFLFFKRYSYYLGFARYQDSQITQLLGLQIHEESKTNIWR